MRARASFAITVVACSVSIATPGAQAAGTSLRAAGADAHAAARPTVSVRPSTVRRGATVTISGSRWPARRTVILLIGPPRSEASPFSSARTNGAGRFRKSVRQLSSAVGPGAYVVLACRRSCRDKASARLTVTARRRAVTAAAVANRIKIGVPTTVKAGKWFHAEAEAWFDKRVHKPPKDYLEAGLLSTKGTKKCPRAVPMKRDDSPARGWDLITQFRYGDPDDTVHRTVATAYRLATPGRYRFCAYIWVTHYSGRIGDFLGTRHTKVRASKSVRARAARTAAPAGFEDVVLSTNGRIGPIDGHRFWIGRTTEKQVRRVEGRPDDVAKVVSGSGGIAGRELTYPLRNGKRKCYRVYDFTSKRGKTLQDFRSNCRFLKTRKGTRVGMTFSRAEANEGRKGEYSPAPWGGSDKCAGIEAYGISVSSGGNSLLVWLDQKPFFDPNPPPYRDVIEIAVYGPDSVNLAATCKG